MQALSKQQLLAILASARAHSERDWLMILVGYSHGLAPAKSLRSDEMTSKTASSAWLVSMGSLKTVQPLLGSATASG